MIVLPASRCRHVLALPLLIALAGCNELGLSGGRPAAAAIDTVADSAPAPESPARPKAATRAAARGDRSYPSAADVMHGPSRTDTARPAAVPRPNPSAPVRSDLERLVRAQDQHMANTGGYAARFQYLGLRYVPNAGVNISIESATDSGWVGRGTRTGWEGRSCVVWVGRPEAQPATDRQGLRPPRSGIPVCDSL
ncbi:MAG TPA: hypothetical protein VF037_02700 [Gemmatimonadales bacterium]